MTSSSARGLRELGLLRDEAASLEAAAEARPLHLALGYELDRLPSFVTPAPTITDLVLVHGSCRRTNAAGPDAMAYLDDLIAEHRLDLTRRPQQLFLTGDQIYADDLSGCLLPQINAIGRELLGFTESLPIDNRDVPVTIEDFPCSAAARWSGRSVASPPTTGCTTCSPTASCWRCTCWCGAPAVAPADHRRRGVRAVHERRGEPPVGLGGVLRAAAGRSGPGRADEVEEDAGAWLHRGPRASRDLPGRRPAGRAGAGQPATYMIFDDHEVTDDWYLSQTWRSRVLTAPFGRAVVRNGYAAYAVCQAWGNDPSAFTHVGQSPKPKNEELLDTLVAIGTDGAFSATTIDKLERLLGLTQPVNDPEVPFHYTVPGPATSCASSTPAHGAHIRAASGRRSCSGNSLDAQLPPARSPTAASCWSSSRRCRS